jgi:hypothetical protein
MRKVLLMLLLSVVTTNAMAEGAYQQYECKTESEMNSCANTCSISPVTLNFKINTSNSTVLKEMFNNGGEKTVALEHCKVADADSWVCNSTDINPVYEMKEGYQLSGGIFTGSLVTFFRNGNMVAEYFCAKKRGLFRLFD